MASDGSTRAHVWPILGTMTFGSQGPVKGQDPGILVRSFVGAGSAKVPSMNGAVMIDTARIYQEEADDGDTESTLGQVFGMFPSVGKRTRVATKASPSAAPHYSLSRQSVIDQCEKSLDRLDLDSVEIFYLHWPDIKTDLEDTLSGVEWLHSQGKINEFGLSNYPAWAVVDVWYRCKTRGMIKPTVYQGMYNVITRALEPELLPVVRQFGMRLYIYNPLAGGLLSGKYAKEEDITDAQTGRFSSECNKWGKVYQARYCNRLNLEAIKVIKEAIDVVENPVADVVESEPLIQDITSVVNGVQIKARIEETHIQRTQQILTLPGVALRWLIHHSLLRSGDGIILGVSKTEHLMTNLAAWQAGPLPQKLVDACEVAWEIARPCCEPYFRGLGSNPGEIGDFLKLREQQQEEKESQL